MQTPPQQQAESRRRQASLDRSKSKSKSISGDNVERLTQLLNSALKEKKLAATSSSSSSSSSSGSGSSSGGEGGAGHDESAERVKELEGKLSIAKREFRKYKEECQALRADREMHIDEIESLTELKLELEATLESVHGQLLDLEAKEEQRMEDREFLELTHAKAIALLEKDNLVLQKDFNDALSDLETAQERISELELKLENAGESTALNEMLEDATRRVENLQFEIKGKNAEIEELALYMKKLQDLQDMEKNASDEAIDELKTENRELRIEVSRLNESLETVFDCTAALEKKQVECGHLQETNHLLSTEVDTLKANTIADREAHKSLQGKQIECAQLQLERDELRESLLLFEQEESSTVAECNVKVASLQKQFDDVQSAFQTFKEDTDATLDDKRIETQGYLKEIRQLKANLQSREMNENILNEKQNEIQKLLNAVNDLQEALHSARLDSQEAHAEVDATKLALEKAEAVHLNASAHIEDVKSLSLLNEPVDNERLLQAEEMVLSLTTVNADLESVCAEKSLEVIDLKKKAESLREEIFTEKEITGALIEELKITLSARDNELKNAQRKLKVAEEEISDMKKTLPKNEVRQSSTGDGLVKRMQVLKTQKEAAEHRAEAAESKLLTLNSQILDVTKSLDDMEKEKVLQEKKIVRLEKYKEKCEVSSKGSSNRSATASSNIETSSNDEKQTDIANGSFRVLVATSLAVAFVSLYVGTIIGPLSE